MTKVLIMMPGQIPKTGSLHQNRISFQDGTGCWEVQELLGNRYLSCMFTGNFDYTSITVEGIKIVPISEDGEDVRMAARENISTNIPPYAFFNSHHQQREKLA